MARNKSPRPGENPLADSDAGAPPESEPTSDPDQAPAPNTASAAGMRPCRNCQASMPRSAQFCQSCGEQMPKPADGPRRTVSIRVRALMVGYINEQRYREDDVFILHPPEPGQAEPFSERWMEVVDDSVPERVTTGQQVIKRDHDGFEPVSARTSGPTGGTQVLGD